ncbi:uncharacterized protein C8A04DRAFT_32090 [Dichotomopilus funicola]|uniref:Uncharacterized protein n=1 Tax=Dichotomopilus funicola TaxID=1934379 RepID=A0AAN6UWD6_9PEZI|nr:hypothetical protein C8A04DRAFT_32090 [Dichotomopilus funicola]
MGAKIGTCSVCTTIVEESLQNSSIYNYSKTTRRGKTVITINVAGEPKTWPKESLVAMCWRRLSLDFHYHNSVRRDDGMIACSNF